MTLKRMDNVLIVVDDLEAAKAFFIELGLRLEGETIVDIGSEDRRDTPSSNCPGTRPNWPYSKELARTKCHSSISPKQVNTFGKCRRRVATEADNCQVCGSGFDHFG
jgi:hypothetical protein